MIQISFRDANGAREGVTVTREGYMAAHIAAALARYPETYLLSVAHLCSEGRVQEKLSLSTMAPEEVKQEVLKLADRWS